jgi:hypothetical protein
MSARERKRVEVLSRVAREELTLMKAAELMGSGVPAGEAAVGQVSATGAVSAQFFENES